MEMKFTSLVEKHWKLIEFSWGHNLEYSIKHIPPGLLEIEIQGKRLSAKIIARDFNNYLNIIVNRFKDQKTITEGRCSDALELDKILRSLLIDITSEPF